MSDKNDELDKLLKEISYIGAEDIYNKFTPLCRKVRAHIDKCCSSDRQALIERIKGLPAQNDYDKKGLRNVHSCVALSDVIKLLKDEE